MKALKKKIIALIFLAIAYCLLPTASLHAAIGDAVPITCSSISSGASLSIQPGAGAEWLIHFISFEYNVEIDFFDGTNTLAGPQFLGPDYQPGIWRVTNAAYLKIKNLHASAAKLICYNGVVTK